MSACLPGQPPRKKPSPAHALDFLPYDRPTLRAAVLTALDHHGPLPRHRVQAIVHLEGDRLSRELELMRRQGLVKRIGGRRRGQWALITWQAPEPPAPAQQAFNQAPIPKIVKAPTPTSWWLGKDSRAEFQQAAADRNTAMASDPVWRKGQVNVDRGFEN